MSASSASETANMIAAPTPWTGWTAPADVPKSKDGVLSRVEDGRHAETKARPAATRVRSGKLSLSDRDMKFLDLKDPWLSSP